MLDLLAATVSIGLTTWLFSVFRPGTLFPEIASKGWMEIATLLFFYTPCSPVQGVLSLYLAVNGLPAIFALLSPVPPPRFVAPPLTCHGGCAMWLLSAYLIVALVGVLWPLFLGLRDIYRDQISKTLELSHARVPGRTRPSRRSGPGGAVCE